MNMKKLIQETGTKNIEMQVMPAGGKDSVAAPQANAEPAAAQPSGDAPDSDTPVEAGGDTESDVDSNVDGDTGMDADAPIDGTETDSDLEGGDEGIDMGEGEDLNIDMEGSIGGGIDGGFEGEFGGNFGGDMGFGEIPMPTVKDPIMSNAFFVGGISVVTLAVSIGLGILLAKRKIKKGFELYED